ncbi:hypothetical protein Pmani_035669 [Petrolisthes manimaculis]|uniref:Uncharacterized protein n=1 Tax=Petrolisthes manimaculis TaxID=1843537 RepID=A0AAE1NKC1_9EUCA|nr:hypothetical protein Pmani_035669 [Petrolisthes manimaculis]
MFPVHLEHIGQHTQGGAAVRHRAGGVPAEGETAPAGLTILERRAGRLTLVVALVGCPSVPAALRLSHGGCCCGHLVCVLHSLCV